MTPEISVVLPYFEGERWIPSAIESVRLQEGVIWELIVVDDGSNRSPEYILKEINDHRIRYIKIEHGGKGSALNTGIRAAKADIICILDQDDRMLKGRLRKQLNAFKANPEADLIYSNYEHVDEKGAVITRMECYQASPQECLHKMATGQALICMQNMMIKKNSAIEIGGFSENPNLTGLDDAEFLVRVFTSELVLRHEPTFVHQWVGHGNNYSRGEAFQAARLFLLEHLCELNRKFPVLKKELPYFRYHAFYMRGLFQLENKKPEKAVIEFIKAIRAKPFHWKPCYLFIKSIFLSICSIWAKARNDK